jgi:hypothetical protein
MYIYYQNISRRSITISFILNHETIDIRVVINKIMSTNNLNMLKLDGARYIPLEVGFAHDGCLDNSYRHIVCIPWGK